MAAMRDRMGRALLSAIPVHVLRVSVHRDVHGDCLLAANRADAREDEPQGHEQNRE